MSDTKPPTRAEMKFLGESMIVFGDNSVLGDLMHFEGRGTYDPHYGLVDVTKSEADIHNKALSEARLKGLDENCEIGQGSYAYLKEMPHYEVHDWIGAVISADVSVTGKSVTFRRKGKVFRGRIGGDGDNFNYRRIK